MFLLRWDSDRLLLTVGELVTGRCLFAVIAASYLLSGKTRWFNPKKRLLKQVPAQVRLVKQVHPLA